MPRSRSSNNDFRQAAAARLALSSPFVFSLIPRVMVTLPKKISPPPSLHWTHLPPLVAAGEQEEIGNDLPALDCQPTRHAMQLNFGRCLYSSCLPSATRRAVVEARPWLPMRHVPRPVASER